MPTINAGFALLSEQFMLMAGLAYVVAFCAYAWDLVTYSKTVRRGLAVDSAAGTVSADASRLVGVGASGASDSGAIGQDLGAGPLDRGVRPSSKTHSGSDGITAGDSMRYGKEKRRAARIAVAITVVAAVVHGLAVLFRGLAAGRVPWGNMYEFCTTGGFTVALIFLLVLTRRDLRFLGTFVIGLVLVMITAASVAFWTPAGHLVPALQSYWLIIHVSIAVMSSSLFTLTFAMSVLQLLQSRREASIASGKPDKALVMRLVPNALSLENMSYRINGIAFVGWTLTLMFGSIWAEKAWGRFWGWDTKEVWTFVIWVVYAGYLHARATRGWTGTRAAWLSIVGYLCVVFNFTIVNVYFSGLHSYAGVGS
ncbi:c-type cytochrome biogenesis protein CcsB [Arthrobacter wenxiniae]|jgi:cytochrome c-type biogenesis protein CcsB|uniref:C-type cytochrome biogenesis protein CcsB n=1 Tax=Arthrobacter wenxiniae TaxID=2713570 RepID=A0A7Y7IE11_9MICC|nr:c-type cytochrome biogenesis protein CcsB [Arthrobacter wenxiniae]NVM93477.1 c-type cytochrome biogenesis protein CcsB [Arthrobacter wenxiniae]